MLSWMRNGVVDKLVIDRRSKCLSICLTYLGTRGPFQAKLVLIHIDPEQGPGTQRQLPPVGGALGICSRDGDYSSWSGCGMDGFFMTDVDMA
jgi:hypothetical protein